MRIIAFALAFASACSGASPARPGSANVDSILALADHLAPGHADVTDRIRLAATDPRAYRARFAEDSARTADDAALPRVALEEALVLHDRIAVIDWRDSPEDILSALGPLIASVRPGLHLWTDEEARGWVDGDTLSADEARAEQFVARLSERLASHGLRWIDLGSGTDTYALVLVTSADLDRCVALARAAGYSIP